MSPERPLRVVVADDHPVFRDGLVSALEDRSLQIAAAVSTGEAAIDAVADLRPDVVLMDLGMRGIGGVEATRRITRDHPSLPVLVLTMSDDDSSLFAALRAGARGYLLKEAAADDIVHAIRAVVAGQAVIATELSGRVLQAIGATRAGPGRPFPLLTPREFEVLELVAQGLANADIARRLGLAEKTIRNNVSAVLTKLSAASRAEAIALARDAGVGERR